jgi:hypothetical protein
MMPATRAGSSSHGTNGCSAGANGRPSDLGSLGGGVRDPRGEERGLENLLERARRSRDAAAVEVHFVFAMTQAAQFHDTAGIDQPRPVYAYEPERLQLLLEVRQCPANQMFP